MLAVPDVRLRFSATPAAARDGFSSRLMLLDLDLFYNGGSSSASLPCTKSSFSTATA
jgi:hypothetical protein